MISSVTHKITAFILVFILFAHNINTLVIVGEFLVNQDFIAKTLCIQKDNQQGCNGKCQLAKQLVENELDSNSQIPAQESKRIALDVYFVSDINTIESQFIEYKLPQVLLIHKSSKIVKTFLEIDTPPPIFS
ncbi:hypothetical protein OS188_04855 [Xanthomarina sp. F1114]|uniref:hypothetical protein n=1 Tax=Xanthomarina sp. F1114 TaxID=2996019 RepID=UPI00225E0C26|nr:hypothetical protein [Xanthomarina sp. F1114]MCX7547279.1 hypothetical protein [Xanthomarina sp. F1114]